MYRHLICCLIVGMSAGCQQSHQNNSDVGQSPGEMTSEWSETAVQDVGSEPCCTNTSDALAAIDKTTLTETELRRRYNAADPDDPRFYPGKAHPLAYARWHLHRPEGELSHRLSDRFTNIELTTEDGGKRRFYDDLVKDQIVVVSFFYTRCNGICAPTNRSLVQVRRELAKSLGRDVRLISISLDTEHDNPKALKAYAKRYRKQQDEEDPNMPEWVFLCGNADEIDTLRREMGVYDLDPVIDADVTQHAGLLTYGNDRTDRWSALPSMLKPADIVEGILRIAGDTFRDPKHAMEKITERDTWKIQGPLLAMEPWHQKMSIMDLTVNIPQSLPILGTEGITGANLIDLVDSPKAECVRLLAPCSQQTAGTVIASGGVDTKGNLIAQECYVELARHVNAGTLQLDAGGHPLINGVPIRENPDLRFPMWIVDVMGETIGGERLRSCVGHPATAEGYFHRGIFYTVLLQIDAIPQLKHDDSAVRIHKAPGRSRSGQLRVIGTTDLLWVDSDVHIVDSATRRVLGTMRVRKPRGRDHGRFVVDVDGLKSVPRFVFARIDGDSETVRSSNALVGRSTISLLPSASEFILEGPISQLDTARRTITVNGVTVRIPDELSIGGTNNIAGATLDRLKDSDATHAVRSLTASACNSGYLVRIRGQVPRAGSESQTDGKSNSAEVYTASSCAIETAEVVLTGVLESIDLQARRLMINGLTVLFNEDHRFGFSFRDAAGTELSPGSVSERGDKLVGSQVTVKGYSHLFRKKAVGTEYRPVQAQIVAVTVEFPSQDEAIVEARPVDRRSAGPAADQETETSALTNSSRKDDA